MFPGGVVSVLNAVRVCYGCGLAGAKRGAVRCHFAVPPHHITMYASELSFPDTAPRGWLHEALALPGCHALKKPEQK